MIKNHGNLHIEYVPFNHQILTENTQDLQRLAQFYCNLWMFDTNFGEFKKCPICEKYYNEEECLTITSCSGVDTPHKETVLVPGWEVNSVIKDILEETDIYGEDFYGAYALDIDTQKIIGFVWGWLEPKDKICKRWKESTLALLNNKDSTYFAEIALDPTKLPKELQTENKKYIYRGGKIGQNMCNMLLSWMKEKYPDSPSFLRTHKDSPARKMFEKAGYRYFADDPEHGDGRIMMMIHRGRNLFV